ncbi:MAG: Uma2 family endonuclease, partial [Betaproteobacteria bacterium]|nr:Uma2 family endonuclease [Betaproteobacteria bacterium]
RHKLTTDDFHRMADAGIFREGDRIELIEGELIDMPPIGSPHANLVDELNHLLVRQAGPGVRVRIQNPVQLSGTSEPIPDVALVKARNYAKAHPGPEDILLLIEVSDTSASYDRRVKLPLYAHHSIAEVWIIDVNAGNLERYTEPRGERYEACDYLDRQHVASPALLPEVKVALMDLL